MTAPPTRGDGSGMVERLPEGGCDREPVQVDPHRGLDELGVVAAAEPGRHLDHHRPLRADAELGVGRAVRDAQRGHGSFGHVRGQTPDVARPDMCESDTEGRRRRGDPVGDGEGGEHTVHREPDDRHLRTVDELLDEREAVAGRAARHLDRRAEPVGRLDEGEALLALPVGRLDDDRAGDLRQPVVAADHPRPRLGHTGRLEPLALPQLVRREHGRLRRDRMRQPGVLGDPRGDAHRPVRPRGDDPVDPERAHEPLDRGLVLGREDAPPVGEREPGRARIAIDHAQPEAACTRRLEQTELSRAGP